GPWPGRSPWSGYCARSAAPASRPAAPCASPRARKSAPYPAQSRVGAKPRRHHRGSIADVSGRASSHSGVGNSGGHCTGKRRLGDTAASACAATRLSSSGLSLFLPPIQLPQPRQAVADLDLQATLARLVVTAGLHALGEIILAGGIGVGFIVGIAVGLAVAELFHQPGRGVAQVQRHRRSEERRGGAEGRARW